MHGISQVLRDQLSHERCRSQVPTWRRSPQAPWGLATAEVAAMLLLYFVAVPSALLVRRSVTAYSYGFNRCLEDVVALSLARGLAVTVAYFTGAGAKHHRWSHHYLM